ncbi:MAG: Spy/CpxP family protein refolding chaperone [Sulfurimonas sp.]|uniref:Spy/CpxP family protein refolding chaperone n=1 Tax=Sulfurimonas sp. TaxID=2022749 RepID=UPI00260A3291|nr:Spy/CpxP family protein refolding chaperone [Sulfurimonas sp.]MDD3475353.1 Spy/CpxP family protein refolding chaperone [Sulfurimonas sp.]
MNKKIILGLTTALFLTTSVMAYNKNQQMPQGCEKSTVCNMQNANKHKGSHKFVNMIMKLDLTDAQRAEVVSILKESRKNMPNPSNAFTDTSFDKQAFTKLAKEQREARIERKADMIEKIYKVLNPSQKKDLKTMFEMSSIMKKQIGKGMNCNDKSCNGRG